MFDDFLMMLVMMIKTFVKRIMGIIIAASMKMITVMIAMVMVFWVAADIACAGHAVQIWCLHKRANTQIRAETTHFTT